MGGESEDQIPSEICGNVYIAKGRVVKASVLIMQYHLSYIPAFPPHSHVRALLFHRSFRPVTGGIDPYGVARPKGGVRHECQAHLARLFLGDPRLSTHRRVPLRALASLHVSSLI